MKKKILVIALVFFALAAIGAVYAQSGQRADPRATDLVRRLEAMQTRFDNLERNTRNDAGWERLSKGNGEAQLRSLQNDMEQFRLDYIRFLSDGGVFTSAQENQIEVIFIRRLPDTARRIARNLENLVN